MEKIFIAENSEILVAELINKMKDELSQVFQELAERTQELAISHRQLQNTNEELLDALGSVVEFKSMESGEHIKRVKNYTRVLLKQVKDFYPEYGLTNESIELMCRAAALHDLGKIAIPDAILEAPRRLTAEEFEEMKKHTIYGCQILEKFKFDETDFYQYCYDIIRWHHEKSDGRGYPDNLLGDDIPIYCQAVSIADCFDALVSKRVYKDSMSCDEAFQMIKNGECGSFSGIISECFDMTKDELFYIAENIRDNAMF